MEKYVILAYPFHGRDGNSTISIYIRDDLPGWQLYDFYLYTGRFTGMVAVSPSYDAFAIT